jgi:arylsulfatase A-like enzyme
LAIAAVAATALAACRGEQELDCCANLVLISIDSLRADRLGCYGAERDTSPALDAFATQGTLFETVMAPAPWTLPSHVTLLTGLPIHGHRVNNPWAEIDRARRLLSEHLKDAGYRTAGFVSTPFLHRAYGFHRGFDVYENFTSGKLDESFPSHESHEESHNDETAAEVVDAALEWLKGIDGSRSEDQPYLLFLHLWDVHFDYIPPAPFDAIFDPDYSGDLDVTDYSSNSTIRADMDTRDLEHLRALYDGEIRWLDSQLGRFFTELDARSDAQRTLVAVVADHGEEFFEHGEKGHFNTLFEESVRVPWILRFPGVVPAGGRIGGVAALEDVAPTLLALVAAPPLTEALGRDLSKPVRSGDSPEGAVMMTYSNELALRGDDWMVIVNTKTKSASYYALREDPDEAKPLPARTAAPDAVRELNERIGEVVRYARSLPWRGSGPAELDAATPAPRHGRERA